MLHGFEDFKIVTLGYTLKSHSQNKELLTSIRIQIKQVINS